MSEVSVGNPLVTFFIYAYNQEDFIREAIDSAFSQTYEPLQIILSDDSSRDRTFEIMQEMAGRYRGPHEVVLNKNECNLGIGGQINRITELAKGEFLVLAGGDDISFPERTSALVDKWMSLGRGALSIHSAALRIDANGNELGLFEPSKEIDTFDPGCIIGAAHGWSRKVFERFGDINPGLIYEDIPIAFRSSLLDGVYYIDRPLIKHRTGGLSAWRGVELRDRKKGQWRRWGDLYAQMLFDLSKTDLLDIHPLRNKIRSRVADCQLLLGIVDSDSAFWHSIINLRRMDAFSVAQLSEFYFPRIFRYCHFLSNLPRRVATKVDALLVRKGSGQRSRSE